MVNDIIKIASEFRDGILDGQSPNEMCFAVSAPLTTMLNIYGYECRMTKGIIEKTWDDIVKEYSK